MINTLTRGKNWCSVETQSANLPCTHGEYDVQQYPEEATLCAEQWAYLTLTFLQKKGVIFVLNIV